MLETLLYPQSVAVIGASRSPGKIGYEVLRNLIESGFKGEIVPINPNTEILLGRKCYPDLPAYGKQVDHSFIAVPVEHVKKAVASSIKAGVKAVVIIGAGYKEVGAEGAELEKEITRMVKSAGVRLLGPNSMGLINTEHNFNACYSPHMPLKGGISILSQSGALCPAILDWAARRHLGLAKFVSMGNKADLNEVDFLQAFAMDNQTKVIAAYLETITNADAFVKVAEITASAKPVIILKVGTSEPGQRAAAKITGEISGTDIGYGAALKRSGVIRARTFEELLDYAIAMGLQPLPMGDRIAVITNAGGPGVMALDAIVESGMRVAELSEATQLLLENNLPNMVDVTNLIDINAYASPEEYATAVRAVQDDENVDGLVVVMAPNALTHPAETARALSDCLKSEKPVLAAFMGGKDVLPGREELEASGIPRFNVPERAVRAMKAMVDYAAWRRQPPRVVTRFPVNRRRVERVISRHLKRGHKEINEVQAKEILRAYDFTVPEGYITTNPEEAVEIAERIGYPVAMKIASFDIIHKSNVGGVKLNVATAEGIRDTFELMMSRLSRRAPDARIDGIYVEQMAQPGLEVIIGMRTDPEFGPMLMFGLGGIYVEVLEDVTFHLAPITEDEAMQMLLGSRSYSLLMGRRGQNTVDLHAIANGLQHISQLVTDFPQIAELDINPFVVGDFGTPPVVVDARIILSEAEVKND